MPDSVQIRGRGKKSDYTTRSLFRPAYYQYGLKMTLFKSDLPSTAILKAVVSVNAVSNKQAQGASYAPSRYAPTLAHKLSKNTTH